MKKLLMILFFLFYCFISHSQENNHFFSMRDFISIKIKSGYTIHGTSSITLQREGLIYWKDSFLRETLTKEEVKESAKFIPFKELDIQQITDIMMYIRGKKLNEINKLEISEHVVIPSGMPTRISFILHDQYSIFEYKVCDEKIDIFIEMMNDLIPEEDRENFGIKLRCK